MRDARSFSHRLALPRPLCLAASLWLAACGAVSGDGAGAGSGASAGAESTAAAANITLNADSAGNGATPTAESASRPGPYRVGTYTAGIRVPPDAPYASPMIFYPTSGTGPYPGVVFIPGHNDVYLDNPPVLTQWGNLLASHGFVVLFVNPSDLGADPAGRSRALLAALDGLAAENTRAGGPLMGKLDEQRMAVMGHSYGGSGALFAAASKRSSRLKAAVGLCPVPDTKGPFYVTDEVPSLLVAGVGDFYTAGSIEAQYDSIPSTTPKILAMFTRTSDVILGSMHLIAHSPLGAHPQDKSVARVVHAFLEVYLMGDTRYQPFLVADPKFMDAFNYNP